jgi:hypothetical protein
MARESNARCIREQEQASYTKHWGRESSDIASLHNCECSVQSTSTGALMMLRTSSVVKVCPCHHDGHAAVHARMACPRDSQ